ncbi:MAG TPA: glycosyltransferase [Solirubrobacteraceae bacterium]|nr:glycosyltransferase [Solirubrobacteraceae bacterium]
MSGFIATQPDPPAFDGLRVAVVHDWFQGYHGSERVVEAIADGVFASAACVDIFTFSAADAVIPPRLAARIVKRSRLAGLPGLRQRGHSPGRWRVLLPLMPRYFRQLDLSGYDIVVASSHSCALHARPGPGAAHVCYSHTPMRYAWLSDVDGRRLAGIQGRALGALSGWLRRIDHQAAQRIDSFVANSSAVAERIRMFYGRDAVVIFPPVDIDDFPVSGTRDRDRFLWAHRMVAYKRPLEVMEAFRGSQLRLTMIGVGPLLDEVRARRPSNVDVHGWLDRAAFTAEYARAGAFIHIGEEDFGITMVEALAAGLPVIALDRGGARDIVRDGIDGVLIDAPTSGCLGEAIAVVRARAWDQTALRERAEHFSRDRFVARFADHVADVRAGTSQGDGGLRSGREG